MTQTAPDHSDFCCHDHSGAAQIGQLLERAESVARSRGLRLTPVRRRTLEILLQAHGALGAYDVLQKLDADGHGNQPPVAYRALNFLVEHGFAHRIRRLNAFTACAHPGAPHRAVFLICDACARVTEAPGDAVGDALQAASGALGFRLARSTLEASGLCAACADAQA